MKILTGETTKKRKNKKNNFIPEVIDRIFAICKSDPNFPLKNQIEEIEVNTELLRKKIGKQDNLLEQSTKLKKDLQKRISILDDDNINIQSNLLETLGSELWK